MTAWHALRSHWPEYLIEGWALGTFMISAGLVATALGSPGSPIGSAVSDPQLRNVMAGLAMGTTAIALIQSPWGKRSGAHMNPAVTLTFLRLGKTRTWDAVFYILAQTLGGTLGVLIAAALLGPAFTAVARLKGEADTRILSRLNGDPNFTLAVNCEVRSLVSLPGVGTTIAGVQLADGRQIFAPRVFLAAGALHSPRILARYLEGAGLLGTLPAAAHVGRNLKLHLLTALIALSWRSMTDLIRKTVVITNEQFAHSSVQPLGFDAELISTLVPKLVPGALRRYLGRRAYGFFLQTEDGSDPRNSVLSGVDHPKLDYDESRTPAASREHESFTRAFRWALARAGLISFTRRIGLGGTAHACGSLMCGADAGNSVVDVNGQVHGMKGLYVVDGSVLPRSSRVNPSLTIYAWGLRIADLVTREFHRHA